MGRRDFALIILLLRLGLRRGEVAALTLDDIDWRAGELVVRGKGGRLDRLPLPADVGQALAAYLRRGRPASGRRELFLRARAPYQPIASGTVSSTVRRACRRAGIAEVGAHRLRHTTACAMVTAHVPLERIGQVLRHRSLQCTAIYARVDLESLRCSLSRGRTEVQSDEALEEHVDDYLRLRRALGFKLERHGQILPQLVAYLEAAGASTVTQRAGDLLGAAAGGRAPQVLGGQAGGRARVCRLPADDRPGDRGPAGRVFAVRYQRPTPVPVVAGRTSAGCSRRRAGCARR